MKNSDDWNCNGAWDIFKSLNPYAHPIEMGTHWARETSLEAAQY